ncbi:hypothetical protein CH333_00790 [candidate division WOR-3 bacterium JGI_Cruoil_03_44_89]|mgnify:CR=1 FL=1|uniref:peptidoglycan glycosyltransferase n=1 Tax=candidate division WOR-3 bacterium JGI_Cruoil_03_44_89 TaxID=1973748 RepID=A0A235C0A6_UNCW3|nr:MAG: hypothetical protein CH333_00790 [candidate division WOR-3 bacterium JGI_Cruoil_03_44_89]
MRWGVVNAYSEIMITRKTIFGILTIAVGIYVFATGMLVGMLHTLKKTLPPIEAVERYTAPIVTYVYDENGEIMAEFYNEMRIPTKLKDTPPMVKKTTIAVEDRKFYSHWGINPFSIGRAFVSNKLARKIVRGGSTISQQLARCMFLSLERTYMRKLKEFVLTMSIERTYSKDEILEMYLNQIYYGSGCYGIEAASKKFFGKSVRDLTLSECALLVGLPSSPIYYDPLKYPENALQRRAVVLEVMKEMGIADAIEIQRAKNSPLGVNMEYDKYSRVGPYMVEEIRKNVGERFGSDMFYRGGASIYTCADKKMQETADEVVDIWIKKLEERDNMKSDSSNPLQVALFAMDPRTGKIKAMVGGRDFRLSQFNRAVQAYRQPGSAFKPFLYTAAVDRGYPPTYKLLDQPIEVEVQDTVYSPSNYDGTFRGSISLRDAFAYSRNLASVRLILDIGPETVVKYARMMGIKTKLIPVISLALGSNSVTLQEMVTGYATIANGGYRVKPYIIEKITNERDEALYGARPYEERVLREETAYVMTSLLESVAEYGTGSGMKRMGFRRPAAGKTGTTNEWKDAWFIGFTPELICGVWVGHDKPDTIMKGGTGAALALPIWTEFMKRALSDKPVSNFIMPSGVVRCRVCKESGLLPVEGCRELVDEVFIRGTEPKETCDIHSPGKGFDFRRLDAESKKEKL